MSDERTPTANIAPFGLRMQPDLKARVERAAKANNRSLNSEIIALILDGFEQREHLDWVRSQDISHQEQLEIYEAEQDALQKEYDRKADSENNIRETRDRVARIEDRLEKLTEATPSFVRLIRPKEMSEDDLSLMMKEALEASHAAAMRAVERMLIDKGGRVVRYDNEGNEVED